MRDDSRRIPVPLIIFNECGLGYILAAERTLEAMPFDVPD